MPTPDAIAARAAAALFSRRLLTNIHRAVVVEAIVASALEPDWAWCSGDYASCDFRHSSGTRLEVKQSASLQTWNAERLIPSKCQFDIAERTGEWVGPQWKPGRGRNADLYLLCHHPVVSSDADHRDPAQWRFFLLLASSLPPQKTIQLGAVENWSLHSRMAVYATRSPPACRVAHHDLPKASPTSSAASVTCSQTGRSDA